ncbi:MAG: diguanylate cyclase [Xanthomonadales bacterium]|nr:diguanylate cyclase [Xanthomonadales bacterium]
MIDFLPIMLALGLSAAGEPAWVPSDSFAFRRYSQADGLSDSTIFSVTHDPSGLVWLGTSSGGVNTFDGYTFRSHASSAHPESLSHNDAGAVMADSAGRIWIGTWGAGLNLFSSATSGFHRINPDTPPAFIQVLFEDSKGRIWVGSADAGLLLFDPSSEEFTAIDIGSRHSRIWSIAETVDGRIWAATEAGLVAVEGDRLVGEYSVGDEHPRSILADGTGLWVGTFNSLLRFAPEGPTVEAGAENLPAINTLESFQAGDILIGTMGGLYQFDPVYGRLTPPFGGITPVILPDRNIRDVHVDQTGLLWLATREAGVIVGQPGRSGFSGITLRGSPDAATGVLSLGEGELLLGSRSGLWRMSYGADGTDIRPIPGTDQLVVTQLVETPTGQAWVGSVNGLYRYDPATDELTRLLTGSPLETVNVTQLRNANDGGLWIAAWSDGVVYVTPDLEQHRQLPLLQTLDIEMSALAEIDDRLWAGTWSDGLFRVDQQDGSVRQFTHDPADLASLPHGHIFDLHADERFIWVGTSFGMARVARDSERVERIPLWADQRPAPALSIVDDQLGYLWITTKQGIIRLSKRDLSTTWFSAGDGLVVTEFYIQSKHHADRDKILFGGVGGVALFDPNEVKVSIRPPRVSITRTAIDDHEVFPREGRIEIPPEARSIRLEFSAMDFKRPEHNRFQFFLEGYDPDWSPVTARREVGYANLKPGNYVFRVRAANSNGIWNLDGESLELEVIPHWWESVPGQIAIGTTILFLGWLWHWRRTARIRALNRNLEQRVAAKTQELTQANRQLQQVAVTDYLTGLANRRGFSQVLEQFVPRDGGPARLCLALGDIDNFKQINDRYGHDVGDVVLRQVAETARRALRDEDQIGRWGGEEFIFLLPDTSADEAMQVLERMRAEIAGMRADADQPPREVTITLGIATYRPGETIAHWISRADQAAYAGKLDGKNQVVLSGTEKTEQHDKSRV